MADGNMIRLDVNKRGLLKMMKDSFSNYGQVLRELVQNARRAGSPDVVINYNAASAFLEVIDTGCGIADFGKLIEIATSGWDAETIERESPYGAGFLSALLAADRIEVESNGQMMAANTADILDFKDIEIKPAERRTGARVALLGLKRQFQRHDMESLGIGYPIPVVFNGQTQSNSHAVGDGFVECTVGQVLLAETPTLSWVAYLQGFRIADSGHSGYSANVFHLDSGAFRGRMPDRDKLIDEKEAVEQINKCLHGLWADRMLQSKAAGNIDLLLDNVGILRQIGALWLLNDIDVLPGNVLEPYGAGDLCPSESMLGGGMVHNRMTKNEVAARVVVLDGAFDAEPLDEYQANFARRNEAVFDSYNTLQYLAALEALRIRKGWLDDGHWIYGLPNLVKKVGAPTVKLVKPTKPFKASGHCFNDEFVACESIAFSGDLGDVSGGDCMALVNGGATLALGKDYDPSIVVYQYSAFTDEYDHYIDGWKDEDENTLVTAVRVATNKDPSIFVREALFGLERKEMAGKRFEVVFSRDGALTVRQIKPARGGAKKKAAKKGARK